MKIAFIVNGFPSLSESFIISQITGLLEAGHDIRIFANFNPSEPQIHNDVLKYNLPQRTRYISHIPRNKMLRRLKTICLIALYLIKDPVPLIKALAINLRRQREFHYKPLYYAFALLGNRFDIIHAHFGPAGNTALLLKQAGLTPRVITTFHGYDVNSYPNTAGKNVYNQLFKGGDLFTANTNFTKSRAVELGCDETKIKILPVGLDMNRFTFKARQLKADERVRILTVGRLVEKKGIEYAIRAIAQLTPDHPDMIYSIAGDGTLKKNLQTLASQLNLQQNIEFLGSLPQKEILKLYDRTHLFLLPSVTAANGDREGQALVLQEAQACGIPVVSTIHNGIPDGVLDSKSGFLVPEKDVDALAEKLRYLIQNPQLWPHMGRAGREFVEKKYDIKNLNKQLVDIYEKVIK